MSEIPQRDLELAAWEVVPTRGWATLTQGTFLRGFLLSHGVGNFALGILDNLPLIALCLQPFASLAIGRTPNPRALTMRSVLLERICFLLPVIVVLVMRWETVPAWVLWGIGGSFIVASLGFSGWFTWMAQLAEGTSRGVFIARRARYESITVIVLGLGAAMLLDYFARLGRPNQGYLLLFALAGIIGLGSLISLARIGTAPHQPPREQRPDLRRLLLPWRNPNFRRFLRFNAWLTFGQAIASPYWVVYLLRDLEMSFLEITLYGTLATLASLVCFNFWGTLADRVGVRPLLIFITLVRVINPLTWLFLTPDNLWWILIPEAIATGIFVAGLTPLIFLYALKEGSGEDRGLYLGLYHASQGVAALGGALIGGWITAANAELALAWGMGWTLTIYHVTFILTALTRLSSPLFLRGVVEPDALSVRALWPELRASLRISPARPKAVGFQSFPQIQRQRGHLPPGDESLK